MSPRPILKVLRDPFSSPSSSQSLDLFPFTSCSTINFSPHVHFPPTPILSSVQSTHSPNTYDRASILVTPNSCELPERGCGVYRSNQSSRCRKGSYFHPRAFEACDPETLDANSPSLILDLASSSSESSDSEGVVSPDLSSPPIPIMSHLLTFPHSQEIENQPSFLACSPVMVNELEGGKLQTRISPTRPRLRGSTRRKNSTAVVSSFAEPSVDDCCLGGF